MFRRSGILLFAFGLVLLLAVTPALQLHAAPLPVPELGGRVNDYASMISPQARQTIDQKLALFETEESTQIVVLTIPTLGGEPIEQYSIRVAEAWKIGQKGKDNGILLLVSKNDRKARIEVGYGLEGRLTDLQSGRIIREVMTPAFAAGNYDKGFIGSVDAIMASIKGEYKAPSQKKDNGNAPSIPLVFLILLGLFLYLRIFSSRHGGGPFISGGWPGPGGGFSSGGGFGDGGDGGGFSGGGGGFGGGGASGDW